MMESSTSPSLRLRRLLGIFFAEQDNLAIVASQTRPLFTKTRYIADLGTLSDSVALVEQWLPLSPGQMVIFNERSVSGTVLASLTMVYRLPKSPTILTPLYLCRRLYFNPRGLFEENAKQHVIIPPTPIADQEILAESLIEAITKHPLLFSELRQNLTTQLQSLLNQGRQLLGLLETLNLTVDENLLKDYFREESEFVEGALSHLPEGRTSIQFSPYAKQQICLELEFSRGQLKLDFTGTNPSPYAITAHQTFAAALGSINRLLLGGDLLLNGLSQHIAVVAPRNTLVNGSEIANPLSLLEGASWVAQAVAQALSQYSPQFHSAQHGLTGCPLLFRFPDGESQLILSPVGMAGTGLYRGRNAVFIWNDPTTNSLIFPGQKEDSHFQLTNFHLRRNSGGKGRLGGGNGLVQSFRVVKPCEIEWFYTDERAKGAEGGKAGTAAEIQLKQRGAGWNGLPLQGRSQLAEGDELAILSPGGGAFGPPTQ